ncbi:uncharacterized protein LOC122940080 isoform X2 [Bufo gargarizans]|uniref:uncharacterized protein LOC122940080 isoform X2 n=1 Tax=Bufo gargarizans TaxID=30331 RepID=UPI001CF120AC|nr:uncharacterized protein LOC122940080 isoform X2 [Bufo gargarizans]
MESTDEQGPEQETISWQTAVKSTCRGTGETEGRGLGYETAMESDSDLLENLRLPTLEMLRNEIINPGTQASLSPCHEELCQGSHDTSSSNDDTAEIHVATSPGELEASPAVVETTTEERPLDSEMKHHKEKNKTPFETSSDDTDEWETASEKSVVLEPELYDEEKVGDAESCGQEKHNEDAGHHGQKNILEDAGLHGLELVTEDAGHHSLENILEDAGLHGQKTVTGDAGLHGQKTVSEDAGLHGQKTVGEDAGLHGQETVSEDDGLHGQETVSEDDGLHGQETVSEDDGLHGQETVSEDAGLHGQETVSEDAGLHGQETVSEDAGLHGQETVSEDAGLHGQETVSEDAGLHGQETVSEDDGLHGQETVSEDDRLHGQETVSEDDRLHGQETVSEDDGLHGHETVSEDDGLHGHETVSEDDGLHGHETVSEDDGLHGHETVSEDDGLHGQEAVSEDDGLHGHETVSEDIGIYGQKSVSKDVGIDGNELVSDHEIHGQEMISEDAGLHSHAIVSEDAGLHSHDIVSEDAGLHSHAIVSEDAGLHSHAIVSEDAGLHSHAIVSEDAGLHSHAIVSEDAGLHGHAIVSEDAGLHGHAIVSEDAGLHGHAIVSEDAGLHGHAIVSEDASIYGHETDIKDPGIHGHKAVSESAGFLGQEKHRKIDEALLEEIGKDAEIHGLETVNKDAEPHGYETRSYDHETVSEDAEPHGYEAVSEDAGPHGYETVSEYAEPYDHETVSEDAGKYNHETVSEDAGQYGQKTLSHEMFSEDAGSAGLDTVIEEGELHGHDAVNEEAGSHGQETDSEKAGAYGQDTINETAEPAGEEIVIEEAGPQEQETVNEVDEIHGPKSVTEETMLFALQISSKGAGPFSHGNKMTDNREVTLHSQDASNDDIESYGQETVNEEAKACEQEMVHEETGSFILEPVHDLTRYPNEDTVSGLVAGDMTRPHGLNAEGELQGNETLFGIESEEFDEDCKTAVPDQALNDETTDDKKGTLNTERPYENRLIKSGEILETDELDRHETVCQATLNVCGERDSDEPCDIYIEAINEEVLNVSKESFHEETQFVYTEKDHEEKQDIYKGIEGHKMQGIYIKAVEENALRGIPDPEDTEAGDASMMDMKEVVSEDRIITKESSEESEMAKKRVQMKTNQGFVGSSRLLDENATFEDEQDYYVFKQRWDLTEASSKHTLTEDLELAYVEFDRLEDKLHSSKDLVGTGEGLSEDNPNVLDQDTVHELQYTQVTNDLSSDMDCTMSIETQLDVHSPRLMEEKRQNEPSESLWLGYNAELNLQKVSSGVQEISEPCLHLSVVHTEQTSDSKDDSSLQHPRLSDPEPVPEEEMTMLDTHGKLSFSHVDHHVQEVPPDEPDHYKLEFFPVRLKDIGILSDDIVRSSSKSKAHELLQKSIESKCINRQETMQEPFRESCYQESTLSDVHPVIGSGQDSSSKTTDTNLENVKLVRRQRSNTDPCLILDQEEKPQASSSTGGLSRGRLRSVTPPCDKFTSSYSPTSDEILTQPTTSVLFPMQDENKTKHGTTDTRSAKQNTFYPTQIFNPMLLLSDMQEESGFYQNENFKQGDMENTSQGTFQSAPKNNQVLLRNKNTKNIVVESKYSLKSTEGPSDTKPMMAPSVAPVWLPPQPTRYVGNSGGVSEIRSMKPSENPLVRRPTIRHKKSNVGAKPTAKRFSNSNLPAIPQRDYPTGPGISQLPRIQPVNINKVQISSKNKPLPHQQKISEESDQSRSSSSMETVREDGYPEVKEKTSNSPEAVLLRGSRSKAKPPSSVSSQSIHRRYSTFINSSNLLYQEYSDVALNQEIQRQKPGDSPAEDSQPSSPRVRRRILSSQDSYLQRLSISSADSLWQDIPKIRDSVTFLSMTREEQKLQEAKFELIMSEALYLRSLNIAVDHFQRSAELQEVLSAQDRQWLFSRLSEVRDASSDFLFDLEEEFESNMYNFQVCDVVISHEPNFRRVYLPYVTNQSYQDRTFQRLMNGNPRFQQVLAKLESDPVCQRLSLKSFLILPFQRITRLRLLLQNILKRSAPGSTKELEATEAHNALEKLIRDCNESVQRMKDTEELILLNQKIQFECKIFPLISQSRRLVKHGEVTSLEFNSMSFKWKVTTRPVYLHLFNDCLLLSRIREGGRFVVFDHASEFRVERCEIKLHTNQKNIFRVFLRDSAAMGRESSQDGRETEYIFRTETQSQKLRWICALSPPKEETDFWGVHGLSQMQCLKSYKARENDELSLEKADILMITQNSDDGWLHGIRLSDQQSGWFPQPNVQPISRNACLRNLQEEQRLKTARAKLQPAGAKGQ